MREGRLPQEFRDRTKRFAALVIRLWVKLPKEREENRVCGRQMLRSGTSVAAHVREASRAGSYAEFVSKLGGTLQECDETELWLELLREECGLGAPLTQSIEQEADELISIMTSMIRRTRESRKLKLQPGAPAHLDFNFQLAAFNFSNTAFNFQLSAS